MPKIVVVVLLALCIALPSRPAYGGPTWDCIKSWKTFSLRAFLGVSFIGAVAFAWYGNNKRKRETLEAFRFSDSIPPFSSLMTDKQSRTREARAQAYSGFQDKYQIRALRKLVEQDPDLQKLAKRLGVDWSRSEKRADEYVEKALKIYLHVQEAGLASQEVDNLTYDYLPEMKQMGMLYDALLTKHAKPELRLFSAHMELKRLTDVQREADGQMLPVNTNVLVKVKQWCRKNKVKPADMLQELRNFSPEIAEKLQGQTIQDELRDMSDSFNVLPQDVATPDDAVDSALRKISENVSASVAPGPLYEDALQELKKRIDAHKE